MAGLLQLALLALGVDFGLDDPPPGQANDTRHLGPDWAVTFHALDPRAGDVELRRDRSPPRIALSDDLDAASASPCYDEARWS